MKSTSNKSGRTFIAERIRADFDRSFSERVDRALDTIGLVAYPAHYFADASIECRNLYVDAHWIGCISLSQAVAEGLSRFIAECHRGKIPSKFKPRCDYLRKEKVISDAVYKALVQIHAEDRDHFHHLNKEIPGERDKLVARAKECIAALVFIESEIFAHQIKKGVVVPTHPKYWPIDKNGLVPVQMRNYGILFPEKYQKAG